MDNLRLILLFSLGFTLLLIYQAWMKDYGPQTAPAAAVSTQTAGSSAGREQQPGASAPERIPPAAVPADSTATIQAAPVTQSPAAGHVEVETDVVKAEISLKGGTLSGLWLLAYPVSLEHPERKIRLFKGTEPNLYLAQSGVVGPPKAPSPTHEALFHAASTRYRLGKGQDDLVVELKWKDGHGLRVSKRFHFHRARYVVELEQVVENHSQAPWTARAYYQLQRSEPHKQKGVKDFFQSRTFTGAAYYTEEKKFEKLPFTEFKEKTLDLEAKGGWIAMVQHYFMSAWIPPADEVFHFYNQTVPGPRFQVGVYSTSREIAPGSEVRFRSTLYAGPELQDELAKIAPGLELTVDYGWFTVLAQPIFWLLKEIHKLVGNWGWSIILLTILIKAAFYKLSETSYKSMANMRKLTPRMQALKDRYGDDKQRLNQAMMEMYKKEKINPLGGCLPIVVQVPVFIALYWVLMESVELRQAPFILWIDNLSAQDPYYVLPLIMGVSMFIQQKLNPAPPDPLQAKLMMALPFVFTVFFAFFPSGLVLYWVVNNLLSIAQQWYITRKIEGASKHA